MQPIKSEPKEKNTSAQEETEVVTLWPTKTNSKEI